MCRRVRAVPWATGRPVAVGAGDHRIRPAAAMRSSGIAPDRFRCSAPPSAPCPRLSMQGSFLLRGNSRA